MENLITPIEIDREIGLQIPRSAECLGMKEFFMHIFGKRDEFYGEKKERLIERRDASVVKFNLQELAESAFGNYAPQSFADALRPKLNAHANHTNELLKLITDYESAHQAIYFGQSSLPGPTLYYFHSLNFEFLTYENLSIPKKFRSQTRIKRAEIFVLRAPHNTLIGTCPIKLMDFELRRKTLKDSVQNSSTTLYPCYSLPQLNFDPFHLIKIFEVDTSGFKITKSNSSTQ